MGKETFGKDNVKTLQNSDGKIILRDKILCLFHMLKHIPLICDLFRVITDERILQSIGISRSILG